MSFGFSAYNRKRAWTKRDEQMVIRCLKKGMSADQILPKLSKKRGRHSIYAMAYKLRIAGVLPPHNRRSVKDLLPSKGLTPQNAGEFRAAPFDGWCFVCDNIEVPRWA